MESLFGWRNKLTTFIIVLCLAALIVAAADAQTWRAFTTADGLTGNKVNFILEDQQGDLWVSTDKGLSQFNGLFTTHLEVEIISLLEAQDGTIWARAMNSVHSYKGTGWKEHLSESEIAISSLQESEDGTIWASTLESTATGVQYALQQYNGTGWKEHLSNIFVKFLLPSKDALWAGTADDGLFRYDETGWSQHLPGLSIDYLFESKDGTIWVGTSEGKGGDKKFVLYRYAETTWEPHLLDMNIFSLFESRNGTLWAMTREDAGMSKNALLHYNGVTWEEHLDGVVVTGMLEARDSTIWARTRNGVWHYNGVTWSQHLLGMLTTSIMEAKDGTIWVGTEFDGLNRYNGTTWEAHLSRTYIIHLVEAQDGAIWAGTYRNGLHRYGGTKWESHLGEAAVAPLLESKDGAIWAGTLRYGLQRYDGTTWQPHLNEEVITALLESNAGEIWAGTRNGVHRYNGMIWEPHLVGNSTDFLLESQTGEIWAGTRDGLYHYYDGTTWKKHLQRIRALLESSDGTIWAGTSSGLYSSLDGIIWEQHLGDMQITSLLESKDGAIWAGTTRSLHRYYNTQWEPPHLSGRRISALLESKDGAIWAAEFRNGLHQYDKREIWRQHLSGIEITSLMEAKNGMIWVGTQNNGVLRYDGRTWLTLTVLEEFTGQRIQSILEDRNSNLWFGTRNGIAMYTPDDNPPAIAIINPKEQSVQIGTAALLIEWKAGDVETETHLLSYQYRIGEGTWETTPLTFTTLTSLSEGENIFSVRALDRDLNYSEPAMLTIRVDTIRPNVLISSPVQGAVVGGGAVKIMGGVTDSDLETFRVEYAVAEVARLPTADNFKLIHISSREVEFGQLAEWKTQSLDETQYIIRVRAVDKLGHSKDDTAIVTLDNTPPRSNLIAPLDGARLTKQTKIKGEVSDQHLDGYVLEYTADSNPTQAGWEQIFKNTELQKTHQTEASFNHQWEIPTITGTIFIRLTAIDAAHNTDETIIFVEVPQALTKDKGGEANSADGSASLSIPPRSLPADTIVTINRVPGRSLRGCFVPRNDITSATSGDLGSAQSLFWAYDISPAELQLRSIKPATLRIQLGTHIRNQNQLAVFQWQPATKKWQFLGGTVKGGTITVGITEVGRYAVMSVSTPPIPAGTDVPLTCQPRLFSPKQGDATISFGLREEAKVMLNIYSIDGLLQRSLVTGDTMPAGRHAVLWDGTDESSRIVPSGIYLIMLSISGQEVKTKTVVVQKR